VFHDHIDQFVAMRQAGLDAAYAAHPERFVHGRPKVARPPALVAINPLDSQMVTASALLAQPALQPSPQAIAT
jgi:hypothetical protein